MDAGGFSPRWQASVQVQGDLSTEEDCRQIVKSGRRLTFDSFGIHHSCMPETSRPMQHRRFGRTELPMPVFSCGGMRYQDGWKDKPFEDIPTSIQDNLEATIGRALEVGINHIETARGYGPSERQLGVCFQKLNREELIIQTKLRAETGEEFYVNALDSLDRLQLDYVDLLSFHGINTLKDLENVAKPGGPFDMLLRLREEGRCRFIGFSTHGLPEPITRAIEYKDPRTGAQFDYVNLHWYYIYQETWPCIEAATRNDLGVFIISPSDKGGMLYKPSPRLRDICEPLHPLTFHDLFCLMHSPVHTLSIGAARPSDFEEHLDALPILHKASTVTEPILQRLRARLKEVVEPELRDPFKLGLPGLRDIPGQINIARVIHFRNMVKAYDMLEFAKARYAILGNAGDWVPGNTASPENINAVRGELESMLRQLPAGNRIMSALEEAHEMLFTKPEKRLSES
jgi:predicted aldo/keto reductase-like oxidoreductase